MPFIPPAQVMRKDEEMKQIPPPRDSALMSTIGFYARNRFQRMENLVVNGSFSEPECVPFLQN